MAHFVDVLNEGPWGVSSEAVSALVGAVLDAEATGGALTVVLVEESVIADLNLRYRGLAESTDVLSFTEEVGVGDWPGDDAANNPGPGGQSTPRELGELVVCPEVVRRYAAEDDNEVDRQLAWTIVHGLLHLLGYDHEVDEGEMREREQALLAGPASVGAPLFCAEGD